MSFAGSAWEGSRQASERTFVVYTGPCNTPAYERRPNRYDVCDCGGRKQRTSLKCAACRFAIRSYGTSEERLEARRKTWRESKKRAYVPVPDESRDYRAWWLERYTPAELRILAGGLDWFL